MSVGRAVRIRLVTQARLRTLARRWARLRAATARLREAQLRDALERLYRGVVRPGTAVPPPAWWPHKAPRRSAANHRRLTALRRLRPRTVGSG